MLTRINYHYPQYCYCHHQCRCSCCCTWQHHWRPPVYYQTPVIWQGNNTVRNNQTINALAGR